MMKIPIFYPILDADAARRNGFSPVEAALRMLAGGAGILQFRHKGFFSHHVLVEVEKVANLCAQSGAFFVINDRADIARMTGAALHLGQDDLSPSPARSVMGAAARIGYSTHNEQQLRASASEPVDYLALGPIFGTSSKQNPDPVVGVEELRRLRRFTDRPLVAIGGVTRANARSVIEAGADSVAVIGDLFAEDGRIEARVQEWLEILSG